MFNKKQCPNCNEKISKSSNFCSNCGKHIQNKENHGMLGNNDILQNSQPRRSNSIFGNLNEKMLNKMMGGAMRMLEKEMQKTITNRPNTKVKIMLNGKEIKLPEQNIQQKESKEIEKKELPRKILKNFSKLKKVEPKTKLKRIGDTIMYEIELPKVKSLNDISITQLENSIEIKATAKDKAYMKLIPLGLPITNYKFAKEKLVLEMIQKN